jgi:hypothetical protein
MLGVAIIGGLVAWVALLPVSENRFVEDRNGFDFSLPRSEAVSFSPRRWFRRQTAWASLQAYATHTRPTGRTNSQATH